MVSERVKALMETFDLGDTAFHEMIILDREGMIRTDGPWFVFNWASEKTGCFVPEQTHRLAAEGTPERGYSPCGHSKHFLVVRASSATGADLWTDPILHRTLFFSDRLKRAIDQAKFRKPIRFRECMVIS